MKKVGQTKTHKHTTGSLAKAQANAQSFTICAFAKLPGRYAPCYERPCRHQETDKN